MKPTYFFLLDFIKERKIATGSSLEGADGIEQNGLANFGYDTFTYKKVIATACKTLAILEGIYLLLKKKNQAASSGFLTVKRNLSLQAKFTKYIRKNLT